MSNNFYDFFCPVKIIAGLAALEHAPNELSIRGGSKALLITDSGIKAAGLLEHVLAVFEKSQVEIVTIYDEVPPDSSLSVIKEITDIYRRHQRYAQVPEQQRAETSISVIREMRDQLYQHCQLPRTLKETGKVQKDQFESIARAALNDGSIIFNAKEVGFDDAMRLLESAWD